MEGDSNEVLFAIFDQAKNETLEKLSQDLSEKLENNSNNNSQYELVIAKLQENNISLIETRKSNEIKVNQLKFKLRFIQQTFVFPGGRVETSTRNALAR